METLVNEIARLAISAARRGDTEESRQLIELAACAQRAKVERLNAVIALIERVEKLIDGAAGPDDAPVAEPGI